MYAIVDIETTGGYAAANDITEIAIVLHDGVQVTECFESLIKPSKPIPYFIQSLTGITESMVQGAPSFSALAPLIYEKLRGRIFVAHNVNFDYSFVKHHLSVNGFDLTVPRLCTVRLARKVFPSLPSYSLGNLCRHFSILNHSRHRAGGDATATAQLFKAILENDGQTHIAQFLKRNSREQCLPPNLPREQITNLPYHPGVYYFHDKKGRVIYVGKAKNIKYRVSSHFTHNGAGRQRQEFLRNIYSVSYQSCGTELMAFILENIEIRKYWPPYNSSQKRFMPSYGLYLYEDQSGYLQIAIDKKKPHLKAHHTFNLLNEGYGLLNKLRGLYDLERKDSEAIELYNNRVREAVAYLEQQLPTFAVIDDSYEPDSRSCVLVEKGRFYGMGYLPADASVYSVEDLKTYVKAYPETDYIRGLIYQYVSKRPDKKMVLY